MPEELETRDEEMEVQPRVQNRFIRWSRIGVFDRIFATLAGESAATDTVMIEATHPEAHRTAASLLKKGFPAGNRPTGDFWSACKPRHIGRTKGGLNSKPHAICDAEGQAVDIATYRGAS